MQSTATPAPVWRRIAALCYDLFILTAISFAYGAVITAFAAASGDGGHKDYAPMFDGWLFQLGWVLSLASYYCWCWFKSGQTIGMKTWKIQIRSHNNSKPMGIPWINCITRCIIAPPAVLLLGVGYWAAAVDKNKRSLQDRWSGTWIEKVSN